MRQATFSPDGRHVLTAEGTGAHLWEVKTGREVRDFQPDHFRAFTAVFSSDGHKILVSGTDMKIRLWETLAGHELRQFNAGGDIPSHYAVFSSDDQFVLALYQYPGIVRVWMTATGQEIRRFVVNDPVPKSAVFHPNGRLVLTANSDGTARLWEVGAGREIQRFVGHDKEVNSAVFSRDGRQVLTAGRDGTARLWEVETGREIKRFVGHDEEVNSAVLSHDGRQVLTAGRDGTARLWEVETGREIKRFVGHDEEVDSAVFSPDGDQVLTGSQDTTARLWGIQTGEEIRRFAHFGRSVHSAVFSPDRQYLLTASSLGSAELWDIHQGREVRRFKDYRNVARNEVFSPAGKYLLSLTGDRAVRMSETATGREVRRFEGHRRRVQSAVFSPDGRFVLTASFDETVGLWDTAAGQEVYRFKARFAPVELAIFSPDSRYVLAGCYDGTARLWDMESRREVRRFENHNSVVGYMDFSSDSRRILTLSDRTLQVWEIATGQELVKVKLINDEFKSAVFTHNGKQIIAMTFDHTIRFLDSATGREIRRIHGHAGSTVISPDGRHVLTVNGEDGDIMMTRLWDARAEVELVRLVSFEDDTWVVSTPDGRFDTNNLEEIKGLHWIVSDDPLHALPLEIFMRDYFEPRLLPRVLAGEVLPVVPSVANLNRAQPRVEIKEVRVVDEPQGLVDVRVEVGNQSLLIQRDGQPVPMQSGAYDLRLFRNGQLVAQSPAPEDEEGDVGQSREQELARWRERHRITLDPATGVTTITFSGIRLPRKTGVKDIELSAYAFNVDRVKSATARITVPIPTALRPRPGRAYVVTIGVNAYEQDALSRLSYAARDAQTLGAELSARLRQVTDPDTGQPVFGETQVIPITLVSEFGTGEQAGQLVTNDATKARIQAVIETLAGRSVDAALLQGIANADQLQSARPEDFVLLAFSTHGDTDQRGQFYLMPSDLGAGRGRKDLLEHAISSEELSVWLRSLDAGELVMIVDACHSAASVEDKEFKPGPMGSRGLGQLAFDKGMRILAASQRDQYALETEKTQQGLLSYALVREGLTENKANYKPTDSYIQLSEWLSYGAERVPSLYKDYREGKLKAKAATPLDRPESPTLVSIQRPALFDFARRRDLPISTAKSFKNQDGHTP
ncbi:hypothetical protein YTPLAS18_33220 [Nitrospira sp.]|nr:hypothetical protein YTPLAS18_33220 [Nitrospira sp.]